MVVVNLQIRPVSRTTYVLRSEYFEGLRIAMNRRAEWGRFDPHIAYDFTSTGDTVSAFSVTAAPEILLPEWAHRADADDAHGQAWDSMLAALTQHEQTHFDKFNTWAQRLRRDMQRQRPFPASEFDARCDGFNETLDTLQERYDRTSSHGEREGVRLDDPPSR